MLCRLITLLLTCLTLLGFCRLQREIAALCTLRDGLTHFAPFDLLGVIWVVALCLILDVELRLLEHLAHVRPVHAFSAVTAVDSKRLVE